MAEYYGLDDQPVGMDEWMELMALKSKARRRGSDGWTAPEDDPTRVGYDEIGEVHVSTVWLGLNHAWGDGPPLIYETMVFGGDHDQLQNRYSTRAQAEAGHKAICGAIREGREQADAPS